MKLENEETTFDFPSGLYHVRHHLGHPSNVVKSGLDPSIPANLRGYSRYKDMQFRSLSRRDRFEMPVLTAGEGS